MCGAALLALLLLVVAVGIVAGVERKADIKRGAAVTVHTVKPDDQTLHGVLVADLADRLVLEGAKYITAQGDQPIPGTVVVPKGSVSWLQQHTNEA